jgi:3-hydroxybutyryl-CoA dehydrogenase
VTGLTEPLDVDLVVEAIPELPDAKRDLLAAAEKVVPPAALLASNTSSLSITELAEALHRPERFVGMHFFNPVPLSALVELVVGRDTAPDAVADARRWVALLGKESIEVRDSPGFATSRLGVALGLEAIRMLEEGVAAAADIDQGMVLGYRHPMGPLRLTDLVGLDVRLAIAEHLAATLGPRFDPPALLRQKVADGELGKKTGRGFYDWS